MERLDTLRSRDRQLEVARRYRRDGSLEAERLRIREREMHGPYRLPPVEISWWGRYWRSLAGCLYILAWAVAGAWICDVWWGALIGVAIVSGQIATHYE